MDEQYDCRVENKLQPIMETNDAIMYEFEIRYTVIMDKVTQRMLLLETFPHDGDMLEVYPGIESPAFLAWHGIKLEGIE